MRDLIRELRGEHAVILATLDEIERVIAAGETPDVNTYIEFFETYVEQHHHAKEEGDLFECMRKDPVLSDVVGPLIDDHNEGRRMVEQMRTGGDAVSLLSQYAESLRWHIAKEDSMIFQLVEATLPSLSR